ncbi:MAG: hypothetical protein OQK98_02640 [Gammaproteobacteria bacterium]|nr:hypothetical protein [Gammaproteobacteria bacterium]
MKKSDDTFSAKDNEVLNVINKVNDAVKDETNCKVDIERKDEDYDTKSIAERRGLNNDRRISHGHDYTGPARRMNIDRRR